MNKLFALMLLGLGLSLVFVMQRFDRLAPINEATKTCLVTGASSGIGKHIAIEMVKRGWKVIGVARRKAMLDELSKDLGVDLFIPFVCDVSNLAQVHNVCSLIRMQELKPTLFFLNAGAGELDEKWQFSIASHKQSFATNYFGAIAWVEEWLIPVKQLGGGTFVATSSIMALLATPGCEAYATSKAALLYCFEALSKQYFYDNIGFSVVLPGSVDTEMLKGESAKFLPFKHQPDQEARYIIDQVFAGKKIIEPSWFYSIVFRLLRFLPDAIFIKIYDN